MKTKDGKQIEALKQCIDEIIGQLYEVGEEIFLEQVMELVKGQLEMNNRPRYQKALQTLLSLSKQEDNEIRKYVGKTLSIEGRDELDKPRTNLEEER